MMVYSCKIFGFNCLEKKNKIQFTKKQRHSILLQYPSISSQRNIYKILKPSPEHIKQSIILWGDISSICIIDNR